MKYFPPRRFRSIHHVSLGGIVQLQSLGVSGSTLLRHRKTKTSLVTPRATMRRRFPVPQLLLLFFSSTLLLGSIHDHSAKAEVITLTADTFSDKVQEKDTAWFVKFCVPWCKHCKNLGTLWDDLGKVIESEDEIEIGEVDCGTNKAVCNKVDIHSYPTFKIFYNGEEVVKYQGARDVESLKTFVLEETEKAAAKAQLDNDDEL